MAIQTIIIIGIPLWLIAWKMYTTIKLLTNEINYFSKEIKGVVENMERLNSQVQVHESKIKALENK
ncbi:MULTISPECIES: hypothetical protein [Leuconostoc]|jgi:hypothetical protein|uniref:Uncharacterized protein n=2 Tax=Leuconostoc TaxID=1243 RepID=A0AAE6M259_LEUCA|nr:MULTISPECIES: hypothetical protein [Leuconostoc]MDN6081252.1 hypothetical protein [Leuconostoc sp.]MBD9363844.1 hypothetical protein [Leuconostoc mesenteroides]MBZ1507152.1 hypothetical protein [Leuconostoc mesenteroides]MBZ1523050.1 hypothetical protein [Leuconostoc mesenteroides]MBZ1526297.1 hypothetical protein [Leuconostoc mesenteroides]